MPSSTYLLCASQCSLSRSSWGRERQAAVSNSCCTVWLSLHLTRLCLMRLMHAFWAGCSKALLHGDAIHWSMWLTADLLVCLHKHLRDKACRLSLLELLCSFSFHEPLCYKPTCNSHSVLLSCFLCSFSFHERLCYKLTCISHSVLLLCLRQAMQQKGQRHIHVIPCCDAVLCSQHPTIQSEWRCSVWVILRLVMPWWCPVMKIVPPTLAESGVPT